MYFVVLKVKDRGLPREIQMMASSEDLQDMLAKVTVLNLLAWTTGGVFYELCLHQVKDAVKQVERVMNTTSTAN